jgi:ABC-type phosphate transport system substrate-binding protein
MISIPIGVIYNLEGVKPAGTAIKMSSATVAKVFAGQITKWNDPAIIAENPPITRANPATTLSAKPEISEYGKYKVTLAKTKYQNKARLTVDLDPNFIMKNSKNLVVTYSTATRGATIKKIFDKKPKSGKLVVNVPYQFGTTYTIKLNKKTLGTVSVDARSVPNPDSKVNIELPDTAITVYKRKDTNATTNSFANYLNKTQPTIWYKSSNDAFDSAFPGTVPTDGTFVAAQGNDDLLNGIASKNGAIGYAELPYINERSNSGNPVSVVEIKNGAGEFVPVSATGVKLALSAAAIDANTGVITQNFETTISGAYPITAVIYGLANTTGVGTLQNNSIVKNFVEYFLSTCASRVAKTKGYVDLPDNILNVSKATAARIAS